MSLGGPRRAGMKGSLRSLPCKLGRVNPRGCRSRFSRAWFPENTRRRTTGARAISLWPLSFVANSGEGSPGRPSKDASANHARVLVGGAGGLLLDQLLQLEDSLRSCYVAVRIADALGLSGEQREATYYAALLKDAGCTSWTTELAHVWQHQRHGTRFDNESYLDCLRRKGGQPR